MTEGSNTCYFWQSRSAIDNVYLSDCFVVDSDTQTIAMNRLYIQAFRWLSILFTLLYVSLTLCPMPVPCTQHHFTQLFALYVPSSFLYLCYVTPHHVICIWHALLCSLYLYPDSW